MRSLTYSSHGLSPPTRGSQRHESSLSACFNTVYPRPRGGAELQRCEPISSRQPTVYPRPRGGAGSRRPPTSTSTGLSPPTRGSRTRSGSGGPLGWVYPRPRGGAERRNKPLGVFEGLSPPTRGSPGSSAESSARPFGSIPAHAGEPRRLRRWCSGQRVYPRPRGGAHTQQQPTPPSQGLSPPTRGSHDVEARRFMTQ